MIGIIGVITILVVLGLSLIITRLATVALMLTGLSEQAAMFQARSAFTGTGFTTSEAESVVDHPLRRRIIMILMIVRSAGIISILISLILSFVGSGTDQDKLTRLGYLAGGVVLIWLISQSRWIDRGMKKIIARAMHRWTDLDARDYVNLLNLSGSYSVTEKKVEKSDWLANKPLCETKLRKEGVLVLGIYRSDGNYLGTPQGQTVIEPGDTLILYGRAKALNSLDQRKKGTAGEQEHDEAVGEQEKQKQHEEAQDAESKSKRNNDTNGDESDAAATKD